MQATATKTEYTRWLMRHLGADKSKYIFLSNALNDLEFYYILQDDRNRAVDGHTVRNEYIEEFGEDILEELPMASTVLEVLVAMADKADWTIRSSPYTWFVTFLENLGLDVFDDYKWSADAEAFTVATVHKWLDRRFSPNGNGSPFRSSKHDLTKVSIWDAMQWYLADEFGEGQL